jgi:hypothetical protein
VNAPPAAVLQHEAHGVLGPDYGDADVEALANEVVPTYLSFFNALALERLILAPQAVVMTCGPLASSIVDGVADRLPSAIIQAYEPSEAAIRAAMERTSSLPVSVDFEVLRKLPIKKTDNTFTHALFVHPLAGAALSLQLMRESFRLLVPAGQLLYALPLRGSYPEIADMLREYSLKHDSPKFGEAVEIASQSRPTPETLTEELERLGFVDVAVDVELMSVPFDTGRDFASHPLFELIVAPGLRSLLGEATDVVASALEYAKTAVSKYWSEGQFDLTVNIGCATARKP